MTLIDYNDTNLWSQNVIERVKIKFPLQSESIIINNGHILPVYENFGKKSAPKFTEFGDILTGLPTGFSEIPQQSWFSRIKSILCIICRYSKWLNPWSITVIIYRILPIFLIIFKMWDFITFIIVKKSQSLNWFGWNINSL